RMSRPSMRIAPSVTSYSRDNKAASTDLPDPVAPTSANVSPGSTVTLTCRSAHLSGLPDGAILSGLPDGAILSGLPDGAILSGLPDGAILTASVSGNLKLTS